MILNLHDLLQHWNISAGCFFSFFIFALSVFQRVALSRSPCVTEGSMLTYLYPTETRLNLQLLHQFPGLADTHGAVHWGVSFHPSHKHSNVEGFELQYMETHSVHFCILFHLNKLTVCSSSPSGIPPLFPALQFFTLNVFCRKCKMYHFCL